MPIPAMKGGGRWDLSAAIERGASVVETTALGDDAVVSLATVRDHAS